ncbi:cytochrome c oxidase assembly protein [Demequina lutea]|uniref:Putative copper resistance protein D n=1 Tax=Demequina lutea TaxID=431489 RepID=A0A7Y9ZAQ1_9MICO|nr:cytochrome c oxidase assembly protein [Demequina lutea]NYI41721.1 putative copper resistance protein D [Demequina lutea]
MPTLTVWTLLSSWVFDPLGVSLATVLACLYGALLWQAHRRGISWSKARSTAFFVMGPATLVFATCGGLAAYRSTLFWVAAVQAGVLSAVVPMGLALGDPLALARAAWGEVGAGRLLRLLRSPVARVLMFPLVSSLLAMVSLIVVFLTRYFALSTSSMPVRELLYAQLLVTGSLVVLPILGEEMLPAWCTHPVRVLFAFVDGLLDAVPGVFIFFAPTLLTRGVPGLTDRSWGPTPAWDQQLGGGALITVTELVGLPVLAAIITAWVRADKAEARAVDAALDARDAASGDSELTAPWWASDPRYSDRSD